MLSIWLVGWMGGMVKQLKSNRSIYISDYPWISEVVYFLMTEKKNTGSQGDKVQ